MALRGHITGILNRLIREGENGTGEAPEPARASGAAASREGERQMSAQAEVHFRVQHYPDTDPVIALVFVRDGKPLPPNGKAFAFELSPGTTKLEADTVASLLNRRVVRLVETRADPTAPAGVTSPSV